MSVKHLTDGEIQAYLDAEGSGNQLKQRKHLDQCEVCQMQVRHYRALYGGLAEDRGFELNSGFAATVINALQTQTEKAREMRFVTLLLGFVALVIGLGTALYFLDLNALASGIGKAALPADFNANLFASISKFLSDVNINIGLLGFGILVLILMSAIDHFVLHSRQKPGI